MTTGAGVAAGDRESEAHPERPVSGFLVLGGIVLALLVVVAVLAPVLAPYDPRALSGGALERPSAHHLLGTNDVGHDIFSELVFGARAALWMAAGAASLAVSLGVLVGLGAGLVGGVVDFVVMRVLDVVLALPVLPLLEAGLAFLGLGDPTAVTWGEVMQRALRHPGLYFTDLWVWWLLPAGLAVTVAVLGFAFVGVGLEPRFNPRVRRLL
jgi:ABC-type dipeptide/oligopeptide/nickel transport system permease subunit